MANGSLWKRGMSLVQMDRSPLLEDIYNKMLTILWSFLQKVRTQITRIQHSSNKMYFALCLFSLLYLNISTLILQKYLCFVCLNSLHYIPFVFLLIFCVVSFQVKLLNLYIKRAQQSSGGTSASSLDTWSLPLNNKIHCHRKWKYHSNDEEEPF